MDLTIPFLLSVAAAGATNFLDWRNTVKLVAASGLAGEKNPGPTTMSSGTSVLMVFR